MPTPSSTIDKAGLLALLAGGETRQAIELLRASGELMAHPEKSSRITLLSGRYYRNAAVFQEGTIAYEAHKVEVTQISDALKQFIDQLPDEPLSVLSLPPLPADIQRPEHPYTGLHWFTREDARIFFGRGRDIRQLYEYVTEGERLILLYGQSGVGKSSLLHAGLLPRLEHARDTVYCRRNQERGLPAQLQEILEQSAPKPQLVILDQVEEILTNPNPEIPDEGEALAGLLQQALTHDPRRQFILGFRKEFLAEVKTWLKTQPGMDDVGVFLQPLDRQGILESIQGVSKDRELQRKYKHLEIAPGLAERIADDILHDRQSHQAPLLQMLLRKMWDEVAGLPAQAAFSEELYGAIRQNSLGGMLDDQLKRLAARFPREVEGGLPLDVLAFYTTSGAWVASRSRSDEDLQQAYPHIPHIAAFKHALTALFLLTDSDAGQQGAASRLAHDSLAPLVAGRLQASERPGQRARRILESKQHDIARGVASFKDADDISALEAGRPFMRAWKPQEEAALQRGKEALDRQRAREVAMRQSNFDFAKTRIEEAILNLDYDLAFTETVRALDLNYEQDQLARLPEEIGFVFHACGQSDRAREALQVLSDLGLPQYAPLAASVPGIINQPAFRPLLETLQQIPDGAAPLIQARYLPEMIIVPGGSFLMGSDMEERERPMRQVVLNGFYLQKTPATFWQYHAFLQCEGLKVKKPGWGRQGNNPAVYVSWEDATRFCNWLSALEGLQPVYQIEKENVSADWSANGYRLPTEAEWEYAARGGPEQKPYVYSGSDDLDVVGWFRENTENRTQPVAHKRPNTLGLYDMSGNVLEWCWDWYGNYPSPAQTNPKGPSTGSYRVLRGGSWYVNPLLCRVAYRGSDNPGYRNDIYGFRLARTL